jgi:DnaJ-class molecular chaperone
MSQPPPQPRARHRYPAQAIPEGREPCHRCNTSGFDPNPLRALRSGACSHCGGVGYEPETDPDPVERQRRCEQAGHAAWLEASTCPDCGDDMASGYHDPSALCPKHRPGGAP